MSSIVFKRRLTLEEFLRTAPGTSARNAIIAGRGARGSQWLRHAVFYQILPRLMFDGNGDGLGDFRGLIERVLDYLVSLGINAVLINPMYPSPLRDDGYDVTDCTGVHSDLGTLDDWLEFIDAAHARGIRVVIDLVLNHTSDQCEWFRRSCEDPFGEFGDVYIWTDDPDASGLNPPSCCAQCDCGVWTRHEGRSRIVGRPQFFFHTFAPHQPDLNYRNPKTLGLMLDVMRFWCERGADGFRGDALKHIWKDPGTDCANRPGAHDTTAWMRREINRDYPWVIFLPEVVDEHDVLETWFGTPEAPEGHLIYHYEWMGHLWDGHVSESAEGLRAVLGRMGGAPGKWLLFSRVHDALLLVLPRDAIARCERALAMPDELRDRLHALRERALAAASPERERLMGQVQDISARHPGYRQANGIVGREAQILGGDPAAIRQFRMLLLSAPGVPMIYGGDELGVGHLFDVDRWGLRTPMPWDGGPTGGWRVAPNRPFVTNSRYGRDRVNVAAALADTTSSLWEMIELLAVRARHPAFTSDALRLVDADEPAVLAYLRGEGDEVVLCVFNRANAERTVTLPPEFVGKWLTDAVTGKTLIDTAESEQRLRLERRGSLWLRVGPPAGEDARDSHAT